MTSKFKEWLEAKGDLAISLRLGVSKRTVQSWRLGERQPLPSMAWRLIGISDGQLEWADIYPAPDRETA